MLLAAAFNLSNTDVIMPNSDLSTSPRTVLFILAPGFPPMAYAPAVEPLRAANVLTRRRLYVWRHMTASGDNPVLFSHPPALARLRSFARRAAKIGGVSAGSGGIAALDMMHAMTRNDHGQALAAAVSDWFIQTRIRSRGPTTSSRQGPLRRVEPETDAGS
jgi:transcriptional regulator GlxA family with amidase domain